MKGDLLTYMEFITENLTDIVVLAVFLAFAAVFGRRGLYHNLAGVIVTVLAVLGALLLTRLLAGAVTDRVYPWAAERFGKNVDLSGVTALSLDGLTGQIEQLLPEGFMNLIRKLGLEVGAFVSGVLGGSAVVADAREAANEAVDALLYSATETVVRILLFVLLLLVLRLLLSGLKNALGSLFRLPVIRWVDGLGGAVLGIVVCAILVYVVLWVCDLFQIKAVMRLVGQSKILTAFLTRQ